MRAGLVVLLGVVVSISACDRAAPVAPADVTVDAADLVPDYAVSAAAAVDAAGVGASLLPESLRLAAEQKAAIAALHEAFMKATAADVAALRAIERAAHAAIAAGESRDDVRAIIATAQPIRERLETAFKTLQRDVWAVYTPEQRAWIESHRPRACGPADISLTEDQVKQIRQLQQEFVAAVKPDLDLIRAIAAEARQAREAGKSREEVAAILARAVEPQRRVTAAERNLQDAILALLSPEQRRRWACRHR